MIERPILFSGSMVRALLAGTKTQTRRVIPDDWWRCLEPEDEEDRIKALAMCPHGVPGDRLWVRETWKENEPPSGWIYRADPGSEYDHHDPRPWRPSIFMPRSASRITLELTDVRVQRLQDISEEDATAEAAPTQKPCFAYLGIRPRHVYLGQEKITAREGFALLWDSINGKRAPWDSNPWVWALTFRRLA